VDESDVGPEPFNPDPTNEEDMKQWIVWCGKCAVLRFSRLRDSVETWAFHMAAEEVRGRIGDEAATEFFMQAFPRNSEARAAAMRPLPPVYRNGNGK